MRAFWANWDPIIESYTNNNVSITLKIFLGGPFTQHILYVRKFSTQFRKIGIACWDEFLSWGIYFCRLEPVAWVSINFRWPISTVVNLILYLITHFTVHLSQFDQVSNVFKGFLYFSFVLMQVKIPIAHKITPQSQGINITQNDEFIKSYRLKIN